MSIDNTKTLPIHLRDAVLDDLVAINEIYNYYVEHSTSTFSMIEESIDERVQWFYEHQARDLDVIVGHIDGKVVGWGSLSPYNNRCGYKRTCEISIYLHHKYLAKGIGKAMVADLVGRARKKGCHTLIAGACTENVASIALFTRAGFKEVGRLEEVGHKFDRWLDVALLQLTMEEG